MALTEEQTIIDGKIRNVGYHVKFDHQLRGILKNARESLVTNTEKRDEVISKKDEIYKEFDEIWNPEYYELENGVVSNHEDLSEGENPHNLPDINGMTIEEVRILFRDIYYEEQQEIFQNRIDIYQSNIELIESELEFRIQGLVERDPKGTTFYCSYDGDDTTSTPDVPSTPWKGLQKFIQISRDPGDVCVVRRIRGGFNPTDQIWINNYCADRNAKFDTNGTLIGAFTSSIETYDGLGTSLAGQSMYQHTANPMVGSISSDSGVTSGTVNLPRYEYLTVVGNGNSTAIDTGWEQWIPRTTNPRDKSRVQMMSKSKYSNFTKTVGDTNPRLGDPTSTD